MDKLGSPYRQENPTASEVLGYSEHKNGAMMYSANASSCILRDANVDKVEAKI